jgi:hypothetical protein
MLDTTSHDVDIPTQPTLNKDEFQIHIYKPEWLDFNTAATSLCDEVVVNYGFKASGARGDKYRLAISSLLYVLAKIPQRTMNGTLNQDDVKPTYIGVARSAAALSKYPKVGKDILRIVLDKFVYEGVLTQVEGSGSRGFWLNVELGRWQPNPIMTLYIVDPSSLDGAKLKDARYVQTGKSPVRINGAEHRRQRERRKKLQLAKPCLTRMESKSAFGERLTGAESRVRALSEFWIKHPLVMRSGHAAASATRVYHDGRMDAGGRFYGHWTNFESSYRLKSTIDGKPICQIDIRGSQPTLLSSLLGIKLNGVSDGEGWYDVYTQLNGLWHYGVTNEELHEFNALNGDVDPFKRPRDIAKAVIMEMIGTGNVLKSKPSRALVDKTLVTQSEWDHFSQILTNSIPALTKLEPRYDSDGYLSGYINGPGFLSFHESEIILSAIESLHVRGIPAYPVHDCLIVKESDVVQGVTTLREVVSDYCYNLSGLRVHVPLTVETTQGKLVGPNKPLHPDNLRGEYP